MQSGFNAKTQRRQGAKGHSAAKPQPNLFGLRREAKRHAALEVLSAVEKRCRRCALPPQSEILIPTYRFNEAFKRNRQRFPDDFAFQLTAAEFADLKSKPAISKVQDVAKQEDAANSSQIAMSSAQVPENNPNWSQFVTSSKKHRGATYRSWAFTEHGPSWRRRC
jgi:hypothetical protein